MRAVLWLACLIPSSSVLAQVPAGGPIQVDPKALNFPALGVDPASGRFLVVVPHYDAPGTLVAHGFEAAGSPAAPELALDCVDCFGAAIAAGSAGTFFVAWVALADDGVHGASHDISGAPVFRDFRLGGPLLTPGPRAPELVQLATRDHVAVWVSRSAAGEAIIVGRRFDQRLGPKGPEFTIATASTGSLFNARITAAPNGTFLVAWRREYPPGIFARVFKSDGSPGGPEVVVKSGDPSTVGIMEAAAPIGDGGFVVVWGYRSNWATFLDGSGLPTGSDVELTVDDWLVDRRSVTADETGGFAITWFRGAYFAPRAIRARRFDPAGRPRGPVITVVEDSQRALSDYYAMDADSVGNFVVAFVLYYAYGSNLHGTYAQLYGGLRPAAVRVDTAATPLSDGNGVLEPGEAVDVHTSWRNHNGAPQTFGGALSNAGGPLGSWSRITDAVADYGTVPDAAVAACTDCYGVSISSPRARPAHWDLTVDESITPDDLGQHKRWRLHVGDSFTDVPRSSAFYRSVETVLHNGVSAGCGGRAFCPQSPTTREQMAALLLVGKEGAGYAPAACATPLFADVPASNPFCPFVEELARRGITNGCGGGNYCPGDAVSREQMAVFLLRTLDPALDPPACGTPVFSDVPASSAYCRWIEELARRGIANGCGGGNFCPGAPVTREQMAVFLTATFGLQLYGP